MVLVASIAGVMQGFAIMKFQDDIAHLLLLAVQPKLRRSGIGSSMLKWLEKSCITAGIQQVRLEVRASNQTAQQFYDRHGYSLLGKIAAYYDKRETAIVMGRTVDEAIAD